MNDMKFTTAGEYMNQSVQYQVIDNFLEQEDFLKIKSVMLGTEFPWFYAPFVAVENVEVEEEWYCTHLFYINYRPNSDFYRLVEPIIRKINPKALIRIKGNLYPNLHKPMNNAWHKDHEFPHMGAIFYVNTNNGPTVLKDGTRIESIENRILFFDASEEHHSTHCTDAKVRVNINFNFF